MRTLTARTTGGVLLLAAFALNVGGVVLYSGRSVYGWFAETPTLFAWERTLLMAFYVAAALGAALLELVLRESGPAAGAGPAPGAAVLARLGATAFLLGAAVALVAEAGFLGAQDPPPALVAAMVVVLFAAEALLGAALLASRAAPAWVGWATVAWNVGWLMVLPIVSPGDLYYPILHAVPLLPIGAAALRRGASRAQSP